MNANELADDCKSYADGKYMYPWDRLLEVSNMLRQQHEEIEALKDKLHNVITSSAKRVSDLEISLQEALDEAEMWENSYKSIT